MVRTEPLERHTCGHDRETRKPAFARIRPGAPGSGAAPREMRFIIPDTQTWVGIDVSKRQIDLHIRPSMESLSDANTEVGIRAIVKRLKKLAPTLIVIEATAGMEANIAAAIAAAGMAVAVVNPRQVRSFARAIGTLAKTDSIDASQKPWSPETAPPLAAAATA